MSTSPRPESTPDDAAPSWSRASSRWIRVLGRVRPEERADATAAFLTLFGFMVGHGILETARDALFLARLPAQQLPWVYLAIAVLAIGIGQREPRVLRRLSGGNELSRWLLLAAAVTLGFWALIGQQWGWVYRALYVWSGVLSTLVVVRFWTLLGSRFSLSQAKRIFPLVTSGSVAGAIAGAAMARVLSEFAGPRHLVLAAGVVFLITARVPTAVRDAAAPSPVTVRDDLPRLLAMVWSNTYLRQVATLVLLATVTFTFIDFTFKSAADRLVPSSELGTFFSSVYLALNIGSLLLQVGAVAFVLRTAGVMTAVVMVPVLTLTTTLGFAVLGGLGMVLAMKGMDGVLRHSFYRNGTELLFLPLPQRLRTRVKGFVDVLTQRGGQAVASILILMLLSTTTDERVFAALACLSAVGWLVVAVGLRPHYLEVFRQTLQRDLRTHVPRVEFPTLDVASLETLLSFLNSPDERRVVVALRTLGEQGKAAVIPTLILHHGSDRVVVEALGVLRDGRRDDAVPRIRELLDHRSTEVRAAAVRALGALQPDREVLGRLARESSGVVSVTARAVLVACGWTDPAPEPDALPLSGVAAGEDVELRAALAATARAVPTPPLTEIVRTLLDDPDPAIAGDAVDAAMNIRDPRLVEPLLTLLGRRELRDPARVALAAWGPMGLARMNELFVDATTPRRVRRNLPGAIALSGSPQAPAILLRRLADEPDGLIRFRILRALGRWRAEQPELPLDDRLVHRGLEQAVTTGYRLRAWRAALVRAAELRPEWATETHEVLVLLLWDKQDHALERVFRLLNLDAGTEDFQRLYRGLHSPRSGTRESGRELLRHLVPSAMRRPLMTLVDDVTGDVDAPSFEGEEAEALMARTLGDLVESGMESVSSLALTLARDLRIVDVLAAAERTTPLSRSHARLLSDTALRLREVAR